MVKTARGTEAIDTTSNHLFWDPGERLPTANGTPATADGGHVPAHRDGRMWDLIIQQERHFYIFAPDASVLVHNCGVSQAEAKAQALADTGVPEGSEPLETRDEPATIRTGQRILVF